MKCGEVAVEKARKVAEKIVPSTSSNLLGWGKNASGHLIKNREVLGFKDISAQHAQRLLSELRGGVPINY